MPPITHESKTVRKSKRAPTAVSSAIAIPKKDWVRRMEEIREKALAQGKIDLLTVEELEQLMDDMRGRGDDR